MFHTKTLQALKRCLDLKQEIGKKKFLNPIS